MDRILTGERLAVRSVDSKVLHWMMAVIISIFYAYWLASLPHSLFKDRVNYMGEYAEGYGLYLAQIDSWTKWLFNEPIFLYLNQFLRTWLSPDETVRTIVFFNCFSTAIFCFRKTSNYLAFFSILLVLLFSQASLSMQLVVIRQGFALALIFWFYDLFKGDVQRCMFLFFLGLIHTSFYIVSFFLFLYVLMGLVTKSVRFRFVLLFLLGFVVSSVFYLVAEMLEVKQVSHEYAETQFSGRLFFIWIALYLYFVFFSRKLLLSQFSNIYILSVIGLVILAGSYLFFPMLARMLGTFLLVMYLCLVNKASKRDLIVFFLFFCVNVYLLMNASAESRSLAVETDVFYERYLFRF